jgi:hypothetical protein
MVTAEIRTPVKEDSSTGSERFPLLGATRDERVADTQRERDGATRWWREMA